MADRHAFAIAVELRVRAQIWILVCNEYRVCSTSERASPTRARVQTRPFAVMSANEIVFVFAMDAVGHVVAQVLRCDARGTRRALKRVGPVGCFAK